MGTGLRRECEGYVRVTSTAQVVRSSTQCYLPRPHEPSRVIPCARECTRIKHHKAVCSGPPADPRGWGRSHGRSSTAAGPPSRSRETRKSEPHGDGQSTNEGERSQAHVKLASRWWPSTDEQAFFAPSGCTWTLNVTARHTSGRLSAGSAFPGAHSHPDRHFPFRKTMTAYIRFSKKKRFPRISSA